MQQRPQRPQYLSVTEFAKAIGVHPQTLRRWETSGYLKPHHKTPGGFRYYSDQQVDDYFAR